MKRVWGVSKFWGWGKGVNITILFLASFDTWVEETAQPVSIKWTHSGGMDPLLRCPFNGQSLGEVCQASEELWWPLRDKKIDIVVGMCYYL